jgi:hypothetical protein
VHASNAVAPPAGAGLDGLFGPAVRTGEVQWLSGEQHLSVFSSCSSWYSPICIFEYQGWYEQRTAHRALAG